ncbi:MAG: glycosyltransferase family 2 protein [Ignisphaera sp.]|nr:glycosyltransferase family 2 protein [Ignisphaera sp.]
MLLLVQTISLLAWIYGFLSALRSIKTVSNVSRKCDANGHIGEPISVVIPARNVATTITHALSRLVSIKGYDLEIIVVDDNSDDDTPRIAIEFASKSEKILVVRLIHTEIGWNPKSFACYIGYKLSLGSIIVFLDADTFIDEASLRTLIACTSRFGVSSAMPLFLCSTSICKAVETLLTTFTHAFLGFDKVYSKRFKGFAWFYGCCWAIKRSIYSALEPHKVVKGSIVEDAAIAKYLKSMNIHVAVFRSSIATQWYNTIEESVNAMTRNICGLELSRKGFGASIAILALLYLVPFVSLFISLFLFSTPLLLLGLALNILIISMHIIGARLNRYSVIYAFIAPFFSFIPLLSLVKACRGSVIWRGRDIKTFKASQRY